MPQLADPSGIRSRPTSVVLGELARLAAERDGIAVVHRRELGGSRILFEALRRGEIDVYPEYTGTLIHELLGADPASIRSQEDLATALAEFDLAALAPLGFENTYAIGVQKTRARALGLTKISDLAEHPQLKFAFSSEFMDREDGWPGLANRYGLAPDFARGMDHDLAYRALESGDIDAIDLYSTDADIAYYDLAVLDDDLHYFPEYKALFIYRRDMAERSPSLLRSLTSLSGRVSADSMIAMNARVKLERKSEADSAAQFLGVASNTVRDTRFTRITKTPPEHLTPVTISLSAAIAFAIPLGIAGAQIPPPGTAAPTEDLTEIKCGTTRPTALKAKSSAPRIPSSKRVTPARSATCRIEGTAIPVEHLALFRIFQYVEGLLHLLELRFGLGIVRIHVGMVFARQIPIRLFDVRSRSVSGDP